VANDAIPTFASRPLAAIILAAGKGTRMPGDLPKVVHRVADRPIVEWVVDATREAGARPIVLVVGYKQEQVRGLFQDDRDIEFALQADQRGTGHAVQCAAPLLRGFEGDVLVLCGDGPLIRAETLANLVARHRSTGAAMTLATSVISDPSGYGRIVRDGRGQFMAIVEHKDASAEQLAIREVNPSYYCFRWRDLEDALSSLRPNARSNEYYITDVPDILQAQGKRIEVIDAVPPEDVLSINTVEQLREVDRVMTARLEACR
jgi:bifunctional UDP-N-acetylglucosamine pyrophosphorylase/glucosamine-1-phosphate N-acetyltransferase